MCISNDQLKVLHELKTRLDIDGRMGRQIEELPVRYARPGRVAELKPPKHRLHLE